MADHEAVSSLADFAARGTLPKLAFFNREEELSSLGAALSENVFQRVLMVERRRAERSGRPFALMLIDLKDRNAADEKLLRKALSVLSSNSRESDLIGWYETSVTAGAIFTEIEDTKDKAAASIHHKIRTALQEALGESEAAKLWVSLHVFPEDQDRQHPRMIAGSKLYPEFQRVVASKRVAFGIKRVMDIAGSALLLLISSPLLAAIAVAIKLNSKGPVLFAQERIGQFGAPFKCMKFRTMYVDCDPKIHREYAQQFIAGNAKSSQEGNAKKNLYKLTEDPRVTGVGRFLRKSSLDEFPQFWNVLRGEMSLVGPRPPVAYEFEVYDVWHRRRVLEMKPGVTGLWQVSGRNRIPFQDMVRLDLRYSQKWSLWLDLRILLATPWAVFGGDCA